MFFPPHTSSSRGRLPIPRRCVSSPPHGPSHSTTIFPSAASIRIVSPSPYVPARMHRATAVSSSCLMVCLSGRDPYMRSNSTSTRCTYAVLVSASVMSRSLIRCSRRAISMGTMSRRSSLLRLLKMTYSSIRLRNSGLNWWRSEGERCSTPTTTYTVTTIWDSISFRSTSSQPPPRSIMSRFPMGLRPITGSSLPSRAAWVRSRPYFNSAS
mmetsp:Transcript_22364/g.44752  ORF Transcript_22364/g.44752 Transcript_22364/m.44752 type:complete len:211 (-) Transcript_22364:591-1223(-)